MNLISPKFITFSCEHIQNAVYILYFKTLYKLYKFLFLFDTNQRKNWTNVKFCITLAATNSKSTMHIIHKSNFSQNFFAKNFRCILYSNSYYTELIMV